MQVRQHYFRQLVNDAQINIDLLLQWKNRAVWGREKRVVASDMWENKVASWGWDVCIVGPHLGMQTIEVIQVHRRRGV